MDDPIAVQPGEGELVGTSRLKADRPELALMEFQVSAGGFVQYRRELLALHEQGITPDEAFFERHDVFDV